MQHLLNSAFLIIAGTLLLSSCSDDAHSSEEPADSPSMISFEVSVDNDWQGNTSTKAPLQGYTIASNEAGQRILLTGTLEKGVNAQQSVNSANSEVKAMTRATMIGSANFYDNFYLYGYGHEERLNVRKGEDGRYMARKSASPVASAVTAIAPQYDHPYTDGRLQVKLDGSTTAQTDVMVATDHVEANRTSMSLHFRHIFAAVNFKVGKMGFADDVKINSIAIQGVYTQGSYDVAQDAWTFDALGNEHADLTTIISSTDAGAQENVMLTSGTAGNAFMMIPQTTPAGAKIVVSLTYNHESHTLSFPFGNKVLAQGYTLTFGIGSSSDSYGGYVLSVTNPASIYPFEGNLSQDFVVRSYKNDKNRTPVSWKVDGYSEDGGITWNTSMPEAMALGATTGAGGQEGNSVPATISKPSEDGVTLMTRMLRAAPAVNGYDLSLHDVNGKKILRSTANTYVVRAGGTYLIPLVIGNTIKDGATHIFNGKYADTFVNWKGQQVTKDNYKLTEATGAKVLWCDAGDNVLSDLHIVNGADGLKYLRFKVSKDNMAPGNALLAVTTKDGAKEVTIWSWQIWITCADLSYTIPVKGFTQNKRTYQFSPLPLGCKGNSRRRILVRVRQNESGKTAIVTLDQMLNFGYYDGTYYQWGRKDPMPRSMPNGFSTQKTTASLSTAIMHPECFYYGSKNWCSKFHRDLWSTGKDGNGEWEQNGKTIYDPSPVGYKVPTKAAWSIVDNKMMYQKAGNGYWYYTSTAKSRGEMIFIPMAGYVDSGSASINANGSQCVYWSADNQSTTKAGGQAWGILLYDGTQETIQHVMARGCTVMPVLDTDELSYPAASYWY